MVGMVISLLLEVLLSLVLSLQGRGTVTLGLLTLSLMQLGRQNTFEFFINSVSLTYK